MSAPRNIPMTIAAGDSKDIAGPLDFLRLNAATGTVTVDVNGALLALVEGKAVRFRSGPVNSVTVKNETAVNITATFEIANGADVEDSNLAGTVTVDKATTNADDADTVIAALGTLAIPADSTRRAVVISSDPTNVGTALRVSKTGGARGDFIGPGMASIVNTTDAIKIYNPDASNTAKVGVRYEKD